VRRASPLWIVLDHGPSRLTQTPLCCRASFYPDESKAVMLTALKKIPNAIEKA
jgi:hypothetical protein